MTMQYTKLLHQREETYKHEPEFLQALHEVVESVAPYIEAHPEYHTHKILERMVIPERVISFRVTWTDDAGQTQINTGYRVQYNSAIGPYKGGLRFHPTVNLSVLKFLGFEQIFKNALTGLPMGGGKGGSDFNPKGKSDTEIMRFCQAFMTELARHIGPDTDIPAGDIGVGSREIGYLYGQYKRIRNEHTGVLTGKGSSYGGSLIRPEATGYGALYFAQEMLDAAGDSLAGKKIGLSGFGNVARGAAKKATELGATVLTISGPDGYILDEDGVGTEEKRNYMLELRNSNNDVVAPYAERFGATFVPDQKPREVPLDIAMPCAIQNELTLEDAHKLTENNVQYVVEVSNMGCTADAIEYFQDQKIPFAPGKAANAGGVAVSGLEMSQNASKISRTEEEVDARLHDIMKHIHHTCVTYGGDDEHIDYVTGANIGGFVKVADAMIAQGV